MSHRTKSSGQRRFKRRGQNLSSSVNAIVSVPILDQPFTITSATSGTGGFTTLQGPGAVTATNSVNLDPFNLGARIFAIAGEFLMYRCKRLRIKFIPWTSSSGVVSTPAGATSTPSYLSRPFVWGFVQDPAISTLTYATLRSFGGVFGQSDRPSTLLLKGAALNRWLYVSTTVSSASPPSAIDLRMVDLGQLRWYFGDSSSTNTATHGVIEIDGLFEFRYPANNSSPIGVPLPSFLPPTVINKDKNEQKEEKQPLATSVAKTWF